MLEDLAEMAGIEFLVIDGQTGVRQFKQELRVQRGLLRAAQRVCFLRVRFRSSKV